MDKYTWRESEIQWRRAVPGIQIKTLSYQKEKFVFLLMRVDAGWAQDVETHEVDEYVYVLKGKAENHIGDERTIVAAGDYFVIPANTPHSARVLEDCEMVAIVSPPRSEFR